MEQNQPLFTDFWSGGGAGLANTLHTSTPGGTGHYLRAFGPEDLEAAGIYRQRLANNRGDSYIEGTIEAGPEVTRNLIAPSWDCNNAGFTGPPQGVDDPNPANKHPGCWVAPPISFQRQLTKYPHVQADNYSKGP